MQKVGDGYRGPLFLEGKVGWKDTSLGGGGTGNIGGEGGSLAGTGACFGVGWNADFFTECTTPLCCVSFNIRASSVGSNEPVECT